MKKIIIAYLATGATFIACDSVWLTITASRLYKAELGALMLDDFVMAPAVAFYLLYWVGIVVFAVLPGLAARRWQATTWRGALLGLVAYATYDLTNQATMRGWSSVVTVADLIWGTLLTATAATVGYLVTRRLTPR